MIAPELADVKVSSKRESTDSAIENQALVLCLRVRAAWAACAANSREIVLCRDPGARGTMFTLSAGAWTSVIGSHFQAESSCREAAPILGSGRELQIECAAIEGLETTWVSVDASHVGEPL